MTNNNKRPRSEGHLPEDHPIIAFHREAAIGVRWHSIREAFRTEYEAQFQRGILTTSNLSSSSTGNKISRPWTETIREPSKFWRHCREALAKWVLSQVARYQPPTSAFASVDHQEQQHRALRNIHFLPSREMIAALPDGKTFDEQLIRDLSLKSAEKVQNDKQFLEDVAAFVRGMNLAEQCAKAVEEVEGEVRRVLQEHSSHQRYPFLVRRLEENDPTRNAMQQRIRGPILEIGVDWAAYSLATNCPPRELKRLSTQLRVVSIPVGSWEKLRIAYNCFNRDAEQFTGGIALDPNEAFQYRAATLALRYEHCLASGSLQLCADSNLKRHLHREGYNVIDLCASPINAYMGTTGEDSAAIAPRRFCSAFFDTDEPFGSVGSALLFQPASFLAQVQADAIRNGVQQPPPSRKLLLTLDVPYDEDLCELLFMKLARDCSAAPNTQQEAPYTADYLLVMPLWWDLRFHQVQKSFFRNQKSTTDKDNSGGDADEAMWALIRHHAGYLEHGYRVQYEWPTALPRAVEESEAQAVFDGVFVDTSYKYHCTATNQELTGVTATQVTGISMSKASAEPFKDSLATFYGRT